MTTPRRDRLANILLVLAIVLVGPFYYWRTVTAGPTMPLAEELRTRGSVAVIAVMVVGLVIIARAFAYRWRWYRYERDVLRRHALRPSRPILWEDDR